MGELEIERQPEAVFPSERLAKDGQAGVSKNDWNSAGMPRKS